MIEPYFKISFIEKIGMINILEAILNTRISWITANATTKYKYQSLNNISWKEIISITMSSNKLRTYKDLIERMLFQRLLPTESSLSTYTFIYKTTYRISPFIALSMVICNKTMLKWSIALYYAFMLFWCKTHNINITTTFKKTFILIRHISCSPQHFPFDT